MDPLPSHKVITSREKLQAIEDTRALAAQSLLNVLTRVNIRDGSISEKGLLDVWLTDIRTNPNIFPNGWYINPPSGAVVLAGTITQNSRVNYESLRPESMWSRPDIFLGEKNEMIYVYASPVDRKTGMIGDFGMSIYIGNRPEVIDHIKRCLAINHTIFDYVKPEMPFSELFQFAKKLFQVHNLQITGISITDPAKVNIGHTVPASYENWTEEELTILRQGESNWKSVFTMISKKRKFISSVEKQIIIPGMAVTLEPRLINLHDPIIPLSSYHTIMLMHEDGSKELLTNFDAIFKLTEMNYML